MNYYNEFDPRAAAWLRELIKEGHIPPGDVDTRSITEIQPNDLTAYIQCHFFAGVAGWSLALRLAGWASNRPVWTGSCPCQPFSAAGKGKAQADERHLWPAFFRLIRECRPQFVFGEQVEAAIGHGWLDGISADLEGENYAVGASVLGAHSAGAPHLRQRLYWLAYADGGTGQSGEPRTIERTVSKGNGGNSRMAHTQGERRNGRQDAAGTRGRDCVEAGRASGAMADSASGLARNGELQRSREHGLRAEGGCDIGQPGDGQRAEADGMADSKHNDGRADEPGRRQEGREVDGRACGLEHTESDGRKQRRAESGGRGSAGGCELDGLGDTMREGREGQSLGFVGASSEGSWSNYDILPCLDGKARRVESGTFPLAHGVSGRVGLLRGYGNAIVPQVAAEFIQASIEAIGEYSPREE